MCYHQNMSDTLRAPLEIDQLHARIRACRLCEADSFPISPPPIVFGKAPARFMVIGQAPSLSDVRENRMYRGPAGRKLIGWLLDAGFSEDDIGSTVYMTALTLCFPGRLPGKSTDRAPSARERAHCRPWLDAQMRLVNPSVIIPFGKMAIDTFLPKMSLDGSIGKVFERDCLTYIPLPHSSGASTWLNAPDHRALLQEAIAQIRRIRSELHGYETHG
jgi:uracil-DNA glycosylase